MNENKIPTLSQRWHSDDIGSHKAFIQKRLKPTLIGGIVGDALGVPVEFCKRHLNIKEMQGYGTHNQPVGTWSDDTSLTLCLMENMIEGGTQDDLMRKFTAYQKQGYLTPYGEMFDIGITTSQAISRFESGVSAKNCGGKNEFDNGNGALMRIAPLVATLWKEKDFHKRKQIIINTAEITHAHPRSHLGCIIYMEMLINLFGNTSLVESLDFAVKDCDHFLQNDVLYSNEFKNYERIFNQSITTENEDTIKSDGYVVHSLEAAIWCLFNTRSYKEAVLAAVNLGGDTDTIALLTGTLAGAYYKMGAIPEEWINQLADKENLLTRCNYFIEYFMNQSVLEKYGTLDPYDEEGSRAYQRNIKK